MTIETIEGSFLGWSVAQDGSRIEKVKDVLPGDIKLGDQYGHSCVAQSHDLKSLVLRFGAEARLSGSVSGFEETLGLKFQTGAGGDAQVKAESHARYLAIFAFNAQSVELNTANPRFLPEAKPDSLGMGYVHKGVFIKGYSIIIELVSTEYSLKAKGDQSNEGGVDINLLNLSASVKKIFNMDLDVSAIKAHTVSSIRKKTFGGFDLEGQSIDEINVMNFDEKATELRDQFNKQAGKILGNFVYVPTSPDQADSSIRKYAIPPQVSVLGRAIDEVLNLCDQVINRPLQIQEWKDRLRKIRYDLGLVLSSLDEPLVNRLDAEFNDLIFIIASSPVIFKDTSCLIKLVYPGSEAYLSSYDMVQGISYVSKAMDKSAYFKFELDDRDSDAGQGFRLKTNGGQYLALHSSSRRNQHFKLVNDGAQAIEWYFDESAFQLIPRAFIPERKETFVFSSADLQSIGLKADTRLALATVEPFLQDANIRRETEMWLEYPLVWRKIESIYPGGKIEDIRRRAELARRNLLDSPQEQPRGISITRAEVQMINEFLVDFAPYIIRAAKQDLTFVIGATGSGKSLLINYLLGHRITIDEDDCAKIEANKDLREVPQVAACHGENFVSKTRFPSVYQGYCDTPGFKDTEGRESSHALSMYLAKHLAHSIRGFIIVIDINAILLTKGKEFVDQLRSITHFFGHEGINPTILQNLLFVVNTKSTVYAHKNAVFIKERVLKLIAELIQVRKEKDRAGYDAYVKILDTMKKDGAGRTFSQRWNDWWGSDDHKMSSQERLEFVQNMFQMVELLKMINSDNLYIFHDVTDITLKSAIEARVETFRPTDKGVVDFRHSTGHVLEFLDKIDTYVTQFEIQLMQLKENRDAHRMGVGNRGLLTSNRDFLKNIINDIQVDLDTSKDESEEFEQVILLHYLELLGGNWSFYSGWSAQSETKGFKYDAFSGLSYHCGHLDSDDRDFCSSGKGDFKRVMPVPEVSVKVVNGKSKKVENFKQCSVEWEEYKYTSKGVLQVCTQYFPEIFQSTKRFTNIQPAQVGEFWGPKRFHPTFQNSYLRLLNQTRSYQASLEEYEGWLGLSDPELDVVLEKKFNTRKNFNRCKNAQAELFANRPYFHAQYMRFEPFVRMLDALRQSNSLSPKERARFKGTSLERFIKLYDAICWDSPDPCYDHHKPCEKDEESDSQTCGQAGRDEDASTNGEERYSEGSQSIGGAGVCASDSSLGTTVKPTSTSLLLTASVRLLSLRVAYQLSDGQQYMPSLLLSVFALSTISNDQCVTSYGQSECPDSTEEIFYDCIDDPKVDASINSDMLSYEVAVSEFSNKASVRESWDCTQKGGQLICTDPNHTVLRVVTRLDGGLSPLIHEMDAYRNCEVTYADGSETIQHCVGDETEYVEYRQGVDQMPHSHSLVGNLGMSAAHGAAFAAFPEAIGDALVLSGCCSASTSNGVKEAVSTAAVVLTGSWLCTIANYGTSLVARHVGFTDRQARLLGNAVGFFANTANLSPLGVASTAAHYAGGHAGIWLEKKAVACVSGVKP